MSEQAPRPVGPSLRTAVWIMLVIGAAMMSAALATCVVRLSAETEESPEPQTVTVVRPTADVVVAMRDLARLESAVFHMERIVDLKDQQSRMFGLVDAEDAILLVAAGEVTAGIDLTAMTDGDVVVDPESMTATLTLPPPQVLSTALDNERTYVHSRDTDTLAVRSLSLESRARQEAERTLELSAIEAGLLDTARRNAESALTTLVRALGYQVVDIRWQDAQEI
ncbi:MAG: DUF4230 domain-containing protein [Deltaproteobacteria bacterium]|nr:DUF4230 domain-containing protein [Deltaproteobacteria bacterium]